MKRWLHFWFWRAPIPCDDAAIFPSDRAQRYTAGPAYRGTIRGGGHATLRPNGGRSSGLEAGEVERRRRPAVASSAFARWFVRRRPLRLPGAVFGSIVRSQLQDKMSGELQPRKRPKLRHHPAPVLGDSVDGAAGTSFVSLFAYVVVVEAAGFRQSALDHCPSSFHCTPHHGL